MQTLDERKLAIGQLKSVEKLLEEVIAEKDNLLSSNTKQKHEVQKVMTHYSCWLLFYFCPSEVSTILGSGMVYFSTMQTLIILFIFVITWLVSVCVTFEQVRQ